MAGLRGFSGGSVFITLGAHAVREGFVSHQRNIAEAQKVKEIHTRLFGDFIKDGFERFFQANRTAGQEAKTASGRITAAYGSVDRAMAAMGLSAEKNLGLTRRELGYTAHEFETVAAAAQHTADQQKTAMAESTAAVRKGGAEQRAELAKTATASEASARKAKASWTKGFDTLATAGKYTALGSAVIGGIGIKMAADFQKHMELVHTQAGDSNKEVQTLSKNLLNLAGNVGVGPKQLADGLYHVASAAAAGGSHIKGAAEQFHVLEVAAKGARIGNDDMVSVTNALTAAMNAFHIPAKNAAATMGELDRIAGQGNMVMRELTGAMTTGLLGAAKAVGLQLRDVGAALDTLTQQGVPAQEGATRLRTVLGLIANPTAKAQKAIAELGFTSTTMAEEFRKKGLIGALQDLRTHLDNTFGRKLNTAQHQAAVKKYQDTLIAAGVTGKALDKQVNMFSKSLDKQGEGAIKSSQLIAQAFGGARMGTTMQILMQNLDSVKAHTDSLTKSNKQNTDLFQKHWKETQQTFSQQVAQMWAGLQALLIRIGEKLIPVVQKAIKVVNDFGHWLGRHRTTATLLAVTLGTVLTGAVVAFVVRLVKGMAESTASVVRFILNVDKIPGSLATWAKSLGGVTVASDKTATTTKLVTESIVAEGEAANVAAEAMGRLALTQEAVSKGGVVIPRGASRGGVPILPGAGSGAGAAASRGGGLLSTIRGGASRLGGRAMGGLGIALGGQIVGDMIGTIGGTHTSHAIGHAVSSAAKGAGIGMLFGPEGAVGGAIIGGLVGSLGHFIKGIPSDGQKIASELAKPLRNLPVHIDKKGYLKEVDQVQKEAAHHLDRSNAIVNKPPGAVVGPGVGKFVPTQGIPRIQQAAAMTPAQRAAAIREQEKAGEAVAKGFTDGYAKSWKYFDPGKLIHSFMATFNRAPVSTRNAGAKSVIEWAHGMEAQGRLPKHATEKMIKDLEALYPGLQDYLKKQGEDSQKNLVNNIKDKKVINAVQKQIDDISHLYQGMPKLAKTTAANVRENWVTETENLRTALKHTHGKLHDDLQRAYDKLIKQGDHGAKAVSDRWVSHTASMAIAATKNVASMVGAFADGMDGILSDTNTIAKTFNIPLVKAKIEHKKIKANVQAAAAAGHDTGVGLARGGVVPGAEFGREDHMTLVDPHGKPRAKMAGDEWIFNKAQQPYVEAGLRVLGFRGGAEDLWGSVHHTHTAFQRGGDLGKVPRFKGGGAVQAGGTYIYPHPGFTFAGVDEGVDWSGSGKMAVIGDARFTRVNPQNSGTGWPGAGDGGHGNRGAMLVYELLGGPRAHRYVYTAENIDPVAGLRTGATLKAGTVFAHARGAFPYLEEGWSDAGGTPLAHGHYHNHQPTPEGQDFYAFLKGLAHGKLTGGAGGFAGGATQPLPKVKEPVIGGAGGPVVRAMQMALFKATNGANAYLAKHAPSGGGAIGPMPKGGIMKLAQAAARAAGLAWNAAAARTIANLLNAESHGGQNLPPVNYGGNLDPAGPFQVISSTFNTYAAPGHHNRMNPWDNALAAMRYIKARYHSIAGLEAQRHPHLGYAGYSRGGPLKLLNKGGPLKKIATKVWNKPPDQFRSGGRLPGAVRKSHSARATSGPSTSATSSGKSHHTRKHPAGPSATTQAHHYLSGHQPRAPHIHLPASITHLLTRIGDDTDLNTYGDAVAAIDTKYGTTDQYLQLADGTLTATDFETLIDLREQEGGLLDKQYLAGVHEENELVHQLPGYQRRARKVRREATKIARGITKTKADIKHEIRTLARHRHARAGKMLALADALARKVAANADAQAQLRDRRIAIREKYRRLLAAVPASPAAPTGQIKGIREHFQTLIDAEPTTAGKNRLRHQRDAQIAGLTSKHHAAVQARSNKIKHLSASRAAELLPVTRLHNKLSDEVRHLRNEEGNHRRKYQKQGWADAWNITTKKWKLQDKLAKLQSQEKTLTGSTTGVGKGGQLGELTSIITGIQTAEDTLTGKTTEIRGQREDQALNMLDLAEQEAQTVANDTGQPVDAGRYLRPWALTELQATGHLKGDFHRIFQPDGSVTTGPGATSQAVLAEIAAMDTASQQLFTQFGSNFVAAAPGPIRAALEGAGTVMGPGVRYFGAAGPAGAVAAGYSQEGGTPPPSEPGAQFIQHNYYQSGPQDPHIHAQTSLNEFNTAFG